MSFVVFERASDKESWGVGHDISVIADDQFVVRNKDDRSNRGITFHREGADKYFVQGDIGDRFAYGVLDLKDGAGVLSWIDCSEIDQEKFRAGGGTVVGGECRLDGALSPIELLRSVVTTASGFQQKYVPSLALSSIGSSPPSTQQPVSQPSCIVNDPTPTSAPLQIRVGPNTTKDNPVTGVLYNRTKVQVLDSAFDDARQLWVYISSAAGGRGWVLRKYLKCAGDTAQPVTSDDFFVFGNNIVSSPDYARR